VVVRPDFPAASIDELIALVRARPGRLSFGSAGVGSFAHVMSELIKERTGTFIVHIPYRGGAQILTDLIGGQIDLAITTVVSAAQMASTRRLRMLAVTARERIPAFRDVPTFEESRSLKGMDLQVWAMIFAPPGLPEPLAQRLNAAINAALVAPTVLETFTRLGAEVPPRVLGLAQARAFLQAQTALYRPVIRRIKPE
jgi:tripartite-type tricarboxylate transporter receptor subunit TctC